MIEKLRGLNLFSRMKEVEKRMESNELELLQLEEEVIDSIEYLSDVLSTLIDIVDKLSKRPQRPIHRPGIRMSDLTIPADLNIISTLNVGDEHG
jgi:hypothetical protein